MSSYAHWLAWVASVYHVQDLPDVAPQDKLKQATHSKCACVCWAQKTTFNGWLYYAALLSFML